MALFCSTVFAKRLIIITPSGVGIDLSSTQYLRLTVAQVFDDTASGLCGNGDKYDDMRTRSVCVDPGSNSCSALLQPGSSPAVCFEGCQCSEGNVFDGNKCVPYSWCGCVHQDVYQGGVTVILRRDTGMESKLEMGIGVTMVTANVPLGQICMVSVETLMTSNSTVQSSYGFSMTFLSVTSLDDN
ncbi:IgGFc-binding protein-like [Limanda limanda]|uniref:IgGFc-binding protein-like n=1 Tax=Limanda limanda TaxID=27771 RepID=UPI0029C6ECAF|nr:IgGFc-binding protein-like [Limanda limanda]